MTIDRIGPALSEGRSRRPAEFSFVLKEDPDLAQGLSEADRRAALSLFRAPVLEINGPSWQPPELDPATNFGMLILDGLIGRRMRIGRAVATELLSDGDIVRPWDETSMWEMIPPQLDWRVFTPARVAILDERLTALIGRRPQLLVNFSGRLLRRARSATYLMVVSHLPRVEDRVHATLWHLGSSWGKMTPAGVVIPFRLTHEVLGEIVGAHRPSVTVAMQTLQGRGQLTRTQDGCYVLVGDPPEWNANTPNGAVMPVADELIAS
jgi:CRP/FNR family transcriptional regulator, cyclic AMP receptor protein